MHRAASLWKDSGAHRPWRSHSATLNTISAIDIDSSREGVKMRLSELDHVFGVFLPMANGGWIVSKTTPPLDGSFALNKEVAILADRLGFDFILSMMKWRGYGGATDHWGTSLESMTMMAALAEATKRTKVWCTAHTLLPHPVVIDKMMATPDHISHGRAGLNVVSGAYRGEFEQMGMWRADLDHD